MLEIQIKDFLKKQNLKQSDIYNELEISKQNFYKAIRTKNFDNPSLQKILNFL
jgi:predicted XRE-type DNA-binding protein